MWCWGLVFACGFEDVLVGLGVLLGIGGVLVRPGGDGVCGIGAWCLLVGLR